ncbi:MAG: hypothetical protein PUK08_01930 [Campylobacter lanienae]|nr:hypothetical protein [Campylobacter lanienae]
MECYKLGYPACGALGGSRECNSLSQRSALLTCEVRNRRLLQGVRGC